MENEKRKEFLVPLDYLKNINNKNKNKNTMQRREEKENIMRNNM